MIKTNKIVMLLFNSYWRLKFPGRSKNTSKILGAEIKDFKYTSKNGESNDVSIMVFVLLLTFCSNSYEEFNL